MIALLLFACTAPETPTAEPEAELPSAYDGQAPSDAPPTLTEAGVSAALDEVFATSLVYNADVMFRAYAEVMTYADPECPHVDTGEGGSMWDVNCTSTAGATYSGFVSAYEGVVGLTTERRMRGEATIDLPDGSRMTVAGDASTDESAMNWSSGLLGVMRYDGPAAVGTWVEQEVDTNLAYDLVQTDMGELSRVYLDGSISGLVGEVTAVVFDDVYLSGTPDWPCAAEPAGRVMVRDADGIWAELTFDVTGGIETGWSVDADACDGCADLTYGGEALGRACVDTAPLLAAEIPPW